MNRKRPELAAIGRAVALTMTIVGGAFAFALS